MTRPLLVVLAVCALSTVASAQPVPPGGLRKVVHDTSLTGLGTSSSPLGFMHCVSSGAVPSWNAGTSTWECGSAAGTVTTVDTLAPLQGGPITTTGTVSLALCAANQLYKVNAGGTAWACAADAGGVTGSGTIGDLASWSSSGAIGNFAGSSPAACSAGNVLTRVVSAATGALTLTCTPIGTQGGITGGSLTTNVLPKATSSTALGNSLVSDDGSTLKYMGDGFSMGNGTTNYLRFAGTASANFVESGSSTTTGSSLPLEFTNNDVTVVWGKFDAGGNFVTNFDTQLGDSPADTVTVPGSESVGTTLTVGDGASLGDSTSADSHTIKGRVSVTNTSANNTVNVVFTPSGATTDTLAGLNVTSNGTHDTTAAPLTTYGISISEGATRSAGANPLTSVALRLNAFSSQVPVALNTVSGDNFLNSTGNNTGVGYALGAALPAKLAVSGTADITGALGLHSTLDLNSHQIHNVTDGTSAQDAVTKSQLDAATTGANQVTGTLTSGKSVRATGAHTVGDGAFSDDGTNATLAGTGTFLGLTKLGATDTASAYFSGGVLNFRYGVSGASVGYINGAGYQGGTTALRSLQINDGTGTALGTDSIAYFDGTNHSTHLYGALTVDSGLTVTGATSLDGTLHETGAADFDDTLDVDGAVTMGSSLTVTGRASFTSGVEISTGTTVNDHDGANRPTLTTCGTSPTIVGNDHSGVVTVGTGGSSACTITLHTALSANGGCTATLRNAPSGQSYNDTTSGSNITGVTLTAALGAGAKIDYRCEDHTL